jgi:hypothetical protein
VSTSEGARIKLDAAAAPTYPLGVHEERRRVQGLPRQEQIGAAFVPWQRGDSMRESRKKGAFDEIGRVKPLARGTGLCSGTGCVAGPGA